MKKLKSRRSRLILFIATWVGASFLGIILGGSTTTVAGRNTKIASVAASQSIQPSDEKVVEWIGISKQDSISKPFKLSNFSVRNTRITPYHKFSAKALNEKLTEKEDRDADNWLEDLQFTFKNTSEKTITYLVLELAFSETEGQFGRMAYGVPIGLGPNPTPDEIQYVKPLSIAPGDDFLFTLPPTHLKGMKTFLGFNNFRLRDLNRVEIIIHQLIYDDGIMWLGGELLRPNPNAKHKYERIR